VAANSGYDALYGGKGEDSLASATAGFNYWDGAAACGAIGVAGSYYAFGADGLTTAQLQSAFYYD
jgi:hypothetical protein